MSNKVFLIYVAVLLAALFALAAFMISGSNSKSVKTPIESHGDYETTEIEGCEYIVTTSTGYYGYVTRSLTHKGNCHNPIHQ